MSNSKTKAEIRAGKRAAALRDNLRKRKGVQPAPKTKDSSKDKDDSSIA